MKRISKRDVTETIALAMEHADEMEHVLILYQNKKDSEISNGIFQNDEMTLETANFLCDIFKSYLFNCMRDRASD